MESNYKKGKKNKKKVSENSSLTNDDFDINILKKYLKEKIPHLSIKDYNVVYSIFGQKEKEKEKPKEKEKEKEKKSEVKSQTKKKKK